MKKNIYIIIGIIIGVSLAVNAETYNSDEISYDNTKSHAEATNIKDAVDFLYSHGLGLCPEDMTCTESPVVTLIVEGPGTTSKENVHVRINGSAKFKVTPDEGKTLDSIICTNGYTLGSFKALTNSSREEASVEQEIIISNPGINEGGSCTIRFLDKVLCKRATELHTQGGKTFGSLGTAGTLTSGDAFDCDVNGDGIYNKDNERFYYITNLNTNTAVLLYYSNTSNGVATPSKTIAYNSNNVNHLGPVTAVSDLPSISQWKTTIYSNPRQITNQNGGTTTWTGGGPSPVTNTIVKYNYEGLAARLMTYQEIYTACGATNSTCWTSSEGALDPCSYTMENTKYSDSLLPYGYWLETPSYSSTIDSWVVRGEDRVINTCNSANSSNYFGARPAIEVLKSDIAY